MTVMKKLVRRSLKAAILSAAVAMPLMGARAAIASIDPAVIAEARAAADRGDAQAQTDLGTSLVRGEENLPRNAAEGIALLEKAAAQGNLQAVFNLGSFYYHGQHNDGGTPDYAKARENYQKLIDQNDVRGFGAMAEMLNDPKAGMLDRAAAVTMYEKAFELGDLASGSNLGTIYANGNEAVPADPAKGLEWFTRAADAGHAPAMRNLAVCYEQGIGTDADLGKAVEWLQKAAAAGDGQAAFSMGRRYQLGGGGVEKDPAKAVASYEQAIQANFGDAAAYLGDMQADGEGVDKDLAAAAKTYSTGANLGSGLAMARLGGCYERGEGVDKDAAQAFKCYQASANAGSLEGIVGLGVCYDNGIGCEENAQNAFQCFKDAAEQGEPLAMKNLAILYENGRGVEKDEALAQQWREKYEAARGK